jgi:hypothetical protein
MRQHFSCKYSNILFDDDFNYNLCDKGILNNQ